MIRFFLITLSRLCRKEKPDVRSLFTGRMALRHFIEFYFVCEPCQFLAASTIRSFARSRPIELLIIRS